MSQPHVWTYWAVRLAYPSRALAGVWYWPKDNPRGLNGVSFFKTRAQARAASKARGGYCREAVKITVTIKEAKS